MKAPDNLDLFADRMDGMQRAVEHADRVEPEWSELALDFLGRFARQHPYPFLIEQVIAESIGDVPQPPTTKAWGAIVRRASREGWLVKAGYADATATRNACPKILWRYA